MCTVTGITLEPDPGLRIVCSRDEQRTRGPAQPPAIRRDGPLTILMPTDSDRGGTWIGVNSVGLLAILLNRNPGVTTAKAAAGPSRGEIVPRLLAAKTLRAASNELRNIDHEAYAPFRVLLCDGRRTVEHIGGRGAPPSEAEREILAPFVLSSSGLGDDHVQAPRRKLFSEMLAADPTSIGQDRFHRHRWAERPEISVNMERADARTVSITTVELRADGARMRYEDLVSGSIAAARLDFETSVAWCRS